MIRENKLIWIVSMRSNDVFYGFRNDLYCFTELQKRILENKGIDLKNKEEIEKFLNPKWERDLLDYKKIKDIEKSNKELMLGFFGCLYSAIPHSESNMSSFFKLQGMHEQTTFSQECFPPLLTGTT